MTVETLAGRTSILVIDDDVSLTRGLAIQLRARQYEVRVAPAGRVGLALATEFLPDLAIVDLGLPDLEGTEVIRVLRDWSSLPILVLSGRSDSSDKVEALDLGADDYLTKPFGMEELLARLRALTRRAGPPEEAPRVRLGAVEIDIGAKTVSREGEPIRLTPTEWKLLEALVRNPGILLPQSRLLAEVWGPGYEKSQGSLRLYMGQLRRKLEQDASRPRHFVNEPGLGYRLVL